MKCLSVLSALFLIGAPAQAFDHTHAQWSEVLAKYQNGQGLLNYRKLKADTKASSTHSFNTYLTDIQGTKFSEYSAWTSDEQKAFLINSYNALTVKLIIENYPVTSIKKIGGLFTKPWSVKFFSLLDGKLNSLDPIEHEYLRPNFKDYRIHAAVNCASISCPPLRHEAFMASKLNIQLDDQMKVWLSDKSRNQIDLPGKTFKISKIFDWYKDDFVNWGGGVVSVIERSMKKPLDRKIAGEINIEYMDYDWALNETK